MKTTCMIPVIIMMAAGVTLGQPADTAKTNYLGPAELPLLRNTRDLLRHSYGFTLAVNSMVLGGMAMIGVDLARGEFGAPGFIGFEIGFGGVEMSKYSPIALVRAKQNFRGLRDAWPDTVSYNEISRQICLAATLSEVSMACTFLGEAMIIIGGFETGDAGPILICTGVALGGVALGTSIATSVVTRMAQRALNTPAGSITLHAGASGVGVSYRLP